MPLGVVSISEVQHMHSTASLAATAFLATALAAPLAAQQTVPFRNNIPVAPQGLSVLPPPATPVRYETAEGQNIEVTTLVRGLVRPWSLAFVANDTILVTERGGKVRVIRGGKLDAEPVAGVPEVRAERLAGLMDIALHPDFARNGFVYLSYSKPIAADDTAVAIARGRWDGRALRDTRDVFVAGAETTGGARLAFGGDGMLYVSAGGGGESHPQDPSSHGGKVLRITPDGKVPADNPFVGREGYRPEIYTLGHRSTLGLAAHPVTGRIWQLEMGPNGGDELNLLEPGGNYGWPLVSFGRTYPGPRHPHLQREGFIDAVVFWVPSISTSGLAFYTGDALPKWKGDVFVGGMRYGEIPNTGRLERILFNANMEELRREPLLLDLRQRIRDVRQGPDGLLYLLTDYEDGALLRLGPAP
jgi:glucose/arabinose dehydrogenase